MNNYDRILKLEFAIDKLNAKIYACEKILEEYTGLINQYTYDPKKQYPVDMIKYFNIKERRNKELELLIKIRKNLVKANIKHVKEQAEEYRELQLPEIRSLLHAIDNLK